MKKNYKFLLINIGIPLLFIVFSPFITKLLCTINQVEIELPVVILDKENGTPVLCKVTCDQCEDFVSGSKIAETDANGKAKFRIKTQFSKYPGCPSCFDSETVVIQVIFKDKFESYEIPIKEYTNQNPSPITLNFPK